MKKILALVLALALVLTAVSAFAATNSKENPGGGGGGYIGGQDDTTDETEEPSLEKVGDTDATKEIKQLIIDGEAEGDPLGKLPEDVKGKVPADQKTVNEMVTYQLKGDVSNLDSLKLVFSFETKYGDGEAVTILIGIPADGATEWIVLEGKGNKDGDVEVTVDGATLNKIANNPFVVIPVSK